MTANARPPILTLLSRTPVLALALLGLNVYLCRELFTIEYLPYMSSIESTHIALGRWILEHPFDLQWFPLWYGGVPFHLTYPPLNPALTAGLAALLGLSPSAAYHAVTAATYCLGPVTLFWFACKVSGNRMLSFLAALIFSVVSLSAVLLPDVAVDIGGRFTGRRLQALVYYGEGPHITSLALIPIALLGLWRAMKKRDLLSIWLGALAVATVPLTNWIGTTGLAVAVLALYVTLLDRNWLRTTATAALVGVLAYAIAAPFIPPSNIQTVRLNAQRFVGEYPMGPAQFLYLAALCALLVFLKVLLNRFRAAELTQFVALYAILIGGITVSRSWFGVYAIPQPERQHLEMEMALALLLVVGGAALCHRLKSSYAFAVAGLCVVLLLIPATRLRAYARGLIQPGDITQTLEFQVARWFETNLPGRRVFATGSSRYWLNVLGDSSQLGGGADQAVVNSMIPHVVFGLGYTEANGEQSAGWLNAFGVDAVLVAGPQSRDEYSDYHDPAKFEGVLPEVWREGDDVIYRVPRRSPGLAHVIGPKDEVIARPAGFLDSDAVAVLVEALEDPAMPVAQWEWRNNHQAEIRADLESGQLLYVQVAYHPGWRATLDGELVPIRADGIGQIVIETRRTGPCRVLLAYDAGLEMTLAKTACALALFLLPLFWITRRVTYASRATNTLN